MLTGKSVLKGTIILSVASIITRILGFVYRIYMSQTIGAEGMGLYQMIMSIYSLSFAISSAGFTVSISKLVAVEKARHRHGNMKRFLFQSTFLSLMLSVLVAFLLFTYAEFVALQFIRDIRVVFPLRLLAIAIPFMSIGACFRGYFLGIQKQNVAAFSQIFEQLLRMSTIFLFAGYFMDKGLNYSITIAVLGIVVGEVLSFVYMFFAYKHHEKHELSTEKPNLTAMQALTMILSMAIPLSLSRIIGSGLSTFEDLLIPLQLQNFGLSVQEALSQYGQVTGMAMPLIFFPSTVLSALSTSIIPVIAEQITLKEEKKLTYTMEKSMIFSSIIAMGAAAIFLAFPGEMGSTIYKQDMKSLLFTLGLMAPCWYLHITTHGILNGLGKQLFIFKAGLIASFVSIIGIYLLVPLYGVSGFLYGWLSSVLLVLALHLLKIRGETNMTISLSWFIKPIISVFISVYVSKQIAHHFLFGQMNRWISLVLAIGLLEIIYFLCILALGMITTEDLEFIFPRKKRTKNQRFSNDFT